MKRGVGKKRNIFYVSLILLIGIIIILGIFKFSVNGFSVYEGREESTKLNGVTENSFWEDVKDFFGFSNDDKVDSSENIFFNPGETVTLSGTSLVKVFDDFDNPENSYFEYHLMTEQGAQYKLNFAQGQEPNIISGVTIEVTGTFSNVASGDETIDVQLFEVINEGGVAGTQADNLGEQKVVVVLINRYDNLIEPMTREEVWDRMFNESYYNENDGLTGMPDSLNSWVQEVSGGKTWLSGDVFGWYTDSITSVCYGWNLTLVQEHVDIMQYDRIIIITPLDSSCNMAGGASLGKHTFRNMSGAALFNGTEWSTMMLNGPHFIENGAGSHELGHNFGLLHAGYLNCFDDVIRNDDGCLGGGYGDVFDTMGSSKGHYSAFNKVNMGWLEYSQILQTSQGIHRIEPLETNTNGVKSLKIPIPGTGSIYYDNNYYVEYRRSIGYDAIISGIGLDVYDGVLIRNDHYYSNTMTNIIDMRPVGGDGGYYRADVALRVGETFFDPYHDISIRLLNLTEDYAEIEVGDFLCGNNQLDSGEECDGINFSGESCHGLGYRQGGILSCDSSCRFDTSSCVDPICGEGNTINPDGTCTLKVEAYPGAAEIFKSQNSAPNWDTLRNAQTGVVGAPYDTLYLFNVYNVTGVKGLKRISISFDTSSIPDNALIQSVKLNLTKAGVILNTNPASYDFITLVPVNITNPPILQADDFSKFSSVDNPVELANRVDISELAGDKITFTFNPIGLNYINKTGYSTLGMRAGYDVYTMPDEPYTDLRISLWSSLTDPANGEIRPALEVKFTAGNVVQCTQNADCNDGFSCTQDICNAGSCSHVAQNSLCDNGLYCDGSEICTAAQGCMDNTDSCNPSRYTCDETTNSCQLLSGYHTLTVNKIGSGTGTVKSNPISINCGDICNASYPFGSQARLTANASAGSKYVYFGCDEIGFPDTLCIMNMDSNRSVVAVFDLPIFMDYFVSAPPISLTQGSTTSQTVTISETFSILDLPVSVNIGSLPSGVSLIGGNNKTCTPTPTTCTVTFTYSAMASAQTGIHTVNHIDTSSGSGVAPKSGIFTMTVNPSSSYTVSVNKIGQGTVTSTSNPDQASQLNCGATCTATFNQGTTVNLTAMSASGYMFAGWSNGCSGTGNCIVSSSANPTATFIQQFTLTTSVIGQGNITGTGISCGSGTLNDCTEAYNANTPVTLTANAASGYVLGSWSGCDSVNGNVCTANMNGNRNPIATFNSFSPIDFSLTNSGSRSVARGNSNSTTITANLVSGTTQTVSFLAYNLPSGVTASFNPTNCIPNTVCSTIMTISAGASTPLGIHTIYVNGTAGGITRTTSFTLTVLPSSGFILTVNKTGILGGTVTSNPAGINCGPTCSASYASGTVDLTATIDSNPGFTFTSWSGCNIVNGIHCFVTMNSDKNPVVEFGLTCNDDINCNDNNYCNGVETCNANQRCQAGTAPNINDNIACTVDSCDEALDRIDHTSNNALCSNGLFCDGTEICDPTNVTDVDKCVSGILPCNPSTQTCNEAIDQCQVISCNTGADTAPYGDCNGVIESNEITNYINGYYAGNVNINDLSNALDVYL